MDIGVVAPEITLRSTNGEEFSSRQAVKRGKLILAFFPLAFTPG